VPIFLILFSGDVALVGIVCLRSGQICIYIPLADMCDVLLLERILEESLVQSVTISADFVFFVTSVLLLSALD
jgi:hypothetical protein